MNFLEGDFVSSFVAQAVCAGGVVGGQGGLEEGFDIGRCFLGVALDYLLELGSYVAGFHGCMIVDVGMGGNQDGYGPVVRLSLRWNGGI